MPRGCPTMPWTDDRDERLCRLCNAGKTVAAMAADLGITRGAVSGRLARLRAAGDYRLPLSGKVVPAPRRSRDASHMDALAIEMERGCPSLKAAAFRMMMSIDRVEGLWAQIRRDLGPQAV